jgi:glutamate dehydrogenase
MQQLIYNSFGINRFLGMTTRGIHEYKLGIFRKLGLKEENIIKFQTGGPDGDLGSNEIKISKDKTKVLRF